MSRTRTSELLVVIGIAGALVLGACAGDGRNAGADEIDETTPDAGDDQCSWFGCPEGIAEGLGFCDDPTAYAIAFPPEGTAEESVGNCFGMCGRGCAGIAVELPGSEVKVRAIYCTPTCEAHDACVRSEIADGWSEWAAHCLCYSSWFRPGESFVDAAASAAACALRQVPNEPPPEGCACRPDQLQ